MVLTSNAIGCGLVPIFADAIDRKKIVQLPVTCPGVNSEYSFVTLERYTISPAIKILRQTLINESTKVELRTANPNNLPIYSDLICLLYISLSIFILLVVLTP